MRKINLFVIFIIFVIFAVITAGFSLIGCKNEELPPEEEAGQSTYARKLLILQAYGSSDTAAGVSHSFVELYNATNSAINLNGLNLFYADGTDAGSGNINTNKKDGEWKKIALTGSIPAKGSYLILGPKQSASARHQITDNYGDINNPNFTLSNRAFKVALIEGDTALDMQNPFNTDGAGKKVSGYIDMIGSANDFGTLAIPGRDNIFGFEIFPARNSASEAVRRKNSNDTNDNSFDFVSIRYASSGGITNQLLELRKPRNSADTINGWNPFEEPSVSPPSESNLLIFQVGVYNNDRDSISHSFVELYNAGSTSINLAGYSLQYAASRETRTTNSNFSEDDGIWKKIDLSGTIQPDHSFLIRGEERPVSGSITVSGMQVPAGDINITDFRVHNRGAKIILLNNTTPIENVLLNPLRNNPFNIDGNGTKVAGYVDMVGGINTSPQDSVYGFESNVITNLTGSRVIRRKNIIDTNDNLFDFESIDYRASNAAMTNTIRAVKGPKNHTYGAWDPVTGEKNN